jgi:glucokinase
VTRPVRGIIRIRELNTRKDFFLSIPSPDFYRQVFAIETMGRMYLLTGDIGGTNSRMALYDTCTVNESCCDDKPLIVKYYRNAEHIDQECHSDPETFQRSIVIPFIKYCWEEQEKMQLEKLQNSQIIASLATAGLVVNNRVEITNLKGLVVDGTAIANNLTDPYLKHVVVCRIINDFVAVSDDRLGYLAVLLQ